MSASGAASAVGCLAVGVLVLAAVRATGHKVFVTISGGLLLAILIAVVLVANAS